MAKSKKKMMRSGQLVKKQSRPVQKQTNKHLSARKRAQLEAAMESNGSVMEESVEDNQEIDQEDENEEDDGSAQEMDEGSVADASVTSTSNKSLIKELKVPKNMKTKEEKEAIRKARKKRNISKHHYKIRSANCTGKNGPRAINRGSVV